MHWPLMVRRWREMLNPDELQLPVQKSRKLNISTHCKYRVEHEINEVYLFYYTDTESG